MKVLLLNHESKLGGATHSLIALVIALRNLEVETLVVFPCMSCELVRILKKESVNFIVHKYCWSVYSGGRSSKIKNYILRFLSYLSILFLVPRVFNFKPNIIHSNSLVIDAGAVLAQLMNLPHIWHAREFVDLDHGLKFHHKRKYFEYVERCSDSVICISNSIKDYLSQYIAHKSLITIYNGIDKKFDSGYVSTKSFSSPVKLAILGRVTESKGHFDAVKAVQMLSKSKEHDFHLSIIGPIDKYYLDTLNKFINDNNMPEKVLIYGPRNDVHTLLREYDILLMCSRSEAFGRVTVEAFLSNVNVIGASSGATSEIMINMMHGMTYEYGNHTQLASKILSLCKNKKLQNALRIAAYNHACKNFTSNRNAHLIHDLYHTL